MQSAMSQMQTKMQIDRSAPGRDRRVGQNAKLMAQASTLQAELALIQTKRDAASIDKDEIEYPNRSRTVCSPSPTAASR